MPSHINEFTVERVFRGNKYIINAKRGNSYQLKVNGVTIDGKEIPFDDKKIVNVVDVTFCD